MHDYPSLRPTQLVPRCADKETPQLESTRTLDYIDEAQVCHKAVFHVQERYCKDTSHLGLYNELASLIVDGVPALNDLAQNGALSENLRTWCQNIRKLEWQFRRFAAYLREGTLLPILKADGHANPTRSQTTAVRPDGNVIPF